MKSTLLLFTFLGLLGITSLVLPAGPVITVQEFVFTDINEKSNFTIFPNLSATLPVEVRVGITIDKVRAHVLISGDNEPDWLWTSTKSGEDAPLVEGEPGDSEQSFSIIMDFLQIPLLQGVMYEPRELLRVDPTENLQDSVVSHLLESVARDTIDSWITGFFTGVGTTPLHLDLNAFVYSNGEYDEIFPGGYATEYSLNVTVHIAYVY